MNKRKQTQEWSIANRYSNIQTLKAEWLSPIPSQSLFENLYNQISALTKAKFAKIQLQTLSFDRQVHELSKE